MPKSKSRIPDRWEDYTNIGQVIEGTQFITFKVPLKEAIQVGADLRFTPRMLLEDLQRKKLHLGILIDLTNTDRYYNRSEFEENDVEYNKIFVPGHVIPTDSIFQRFSHVVDTFLDKEKTDYLVGVHCTHGVNRTGYMVCRYMIEKLGIEPSKAIEAYGIARGYPIERENYLCDLRKRKAGQTTLGLVTDDVPRGSTRNGRNDHHRQHIYFGDNGFPSNRLEGGHGDYHSKGGRHNVNQNNAGYSGYQDNSYRYGNERSFRQNRQSRSNNDDYYYGNDRSNGNYDYHQMNDYRHGGNRSGGPNCFPVQNNHWQQYEWQPHQQYHDEEEHDYRHASRRRGQHRQSYGRQNSYTQH